MKNLIINKYMNHIKKNNNYSKEKLEKIEYSLTGIYLTFSKIIIIFLIAIVLGIFKEVLIFMTLFNIIRTFACGLHASKSWTCLISSIIAFIGLPLIAFNLNINIHIKIILCVISTLLIVKNAPADTRKKPMINKKRRIKFKIISVVISLIYFILSVVIKNNFVSNSLIFSLILENILISPISYKLLNMSYNNYILYLEKHPELSN